jgi:hypothetical protein
MANNDRQLIVARPAQTWASALRAVVPDDYYGDAGTVTIPPEFVDKVPEGAISSEMADAIFKALVTPEMLSQCRPHSRQALERLKDQVKCAADPDDFLRLEEVGARIATLVTVDQLAYNLVVNELSTAAKRVDESLFEVREMVCAALQDFEAAQGIQPSQPFFYADEFTRMAMYVASEFERWGLPRVTATRTTKFYAGDQEIDPLRTDALFHKALEQCVIWDKQRDDQVPINNRLIAETRNAFARIHPRLPDAARERTPSASVAATLPAATTASTVTTFADTMLVIEPGAWTASKALWMAYIAWCQWRGMAAKGSRQFFKELSAWGAGRIHRSKRRIDGRQTPGYAGLALRAGEAGEGGHEP